MKTKVAYTAMTQTNSKIKEKQCHPSFTTGPSIALLILGEFKDSLPFDVISCSKSAWKRKRRVHAWSHRLPLFLIIMFRIKGPFAFLFHLIAS